MAIDILGVGIDARQAKVGAREFSDAVSQVKAASREANAAVGTLDKQVKLFGDDIKTAKSAAKDAFANTGAKEAAADVAELNASMKAANAVGIGLRGVLLGAAGAFVGGKAIKDAVSSAAAFDRTLRSIEVASGASAEQMKLIREEALRLGGTSGFDPDSIAQGVLGLAKAGLDARQALGALVPTLTLARAGQISVAEATDTVVATMAQYGISVEGAARITNVLVSGADSTIASVESLARGMSIAGGVAAQFNVPLAETVAALGVMANSAIHGTRAGTALASIMVKLSAPTDEAKRSLDAAGLSAEKLDFKTRGLRAVLQDLRGANGDVLKVAVGVENVPEATALLRGIGTLSDLQQKIEDNTLAANKASAAIGGGLAGAFDRLGSAAKAAAITLADKSGVTGVLESTANAGTDLLNSIAGVQQSVEEAIHAADLRLAESAYRLTASNGVAQAIQALKDLEAQISQVDSVSKTLLDFVTTGERSALVGPATAAGVPRPPGSALEQIGNKFQSLTIPDRATREDALSILKAEIAALQERLNIQKANEAADRAATKAFAGRLLESLPSFSFNLPSFDISFVDDIAKNTERLGKEAKARADATKALGEYLSGLDQETRLLGVSREERERLEAVIRAEEIARRGGITLSAEQVAAIRAEVTEHQALRQAEENTADAAKKAAEAQEEALRRREEDARRIAEKREQLQGLTASLRDEAALVGLSNEARSRAIALRDFERLAIEAQAGDVSTLTAAYAAEYDALQRAQGRERVDDLLQGLRDELEVTKALGDEKARIAGLREFNAASVGLEAAEVAELRDQYSELYAQLERAKELERIAQSAGNSFQDAFRSAALEGQSLVGVLGSLYESLSRIGFDTFTQGFSDLLGTQFASIFGSAKGNVFDGGNVVPFARGGIVSSPQYFPMADGRTGLMGEAGPEAIIPLKRGSNGELGVAGGNRVVNLYITTPDASSFRKSMKQIRADVRSL